MEYLPTVNYYDGLKQNYAKIMYKIFPDVMSTRPLFECITKEYVLLFIDATSSWWFQRI